MEQKGAEFASDSQGIASQIAGLQAQLDRLRAAAISDLADFLSLVGGGSDSAETRRALRDHRELLSALGVSEEALAEADRPAALIGHFVCLGYPELWLGDDASFFHHLA